MLLRIALIVALVVSLGGLAVSFKAKQTLVQIRDDRNQFENERNSARQERDRAQDAERQARTELQDTQAMLAETQDNLERTEANLREQTVRANQLNIDLNRVTQERNVAQTEVARWSAVGRTVEQVLALISDYDALVDERDTLVSENGILTRRVDSLEDRIALLTVPDYNVKLPDTIAGKVSAVDPRFGFVVLNIGSDQELKDRAKLTVAREGQLIGKIQITSLENNRSIANILPGWDLGEIQEGDDVIASYEAIGGQF